MKFKVIGATLFLAVAGLRRRKNAAQIAA